MSPVNSSCTAHAQRPRRTCTSKQHMTVLPLPLYSTLAFQMRSWMFYTKPAVGYRVAAKSRHLCLVIPFARSGFSGCEEKAVQKICSLHGLTSDLAACEQHGVAYIGFTEKDPAVNMSIYKEPNPKQSSHSSNYHVYSRNAFILLQAFSLKTVSLFAMSERTVFLHPKLKCDLKKCLRTWSVDVETVLYCPRFVLPQLVMQKNNDLRRYTHLQMLFVWWLAKRPSNMLVYLRDESAQTIVRAATLR